MKLSALAVALTLAALPAFAQSVRVIDGDTLKVDGVTYRLPEKAMTRTILGAHAEHFIAYLGTAIIMGLTFRKSPRLAVQCVLLFIYAAILEAGQLYSPGRHASFQDLAFSSAGLVTGGLFLWMARPSILGWLKIG
jgi:VanZ family protein